MKKCYVIITPCSRFESVFFYNLKRKAIIVSRLDIGNYQKYRKESLEKENIIIPEAKRELIPNDLLKNILSKEIGLISSAKNLFLSNLNCTPEGVDIILEILRKNGYAPPKILFSEMERDYLINKKTISLIDNDKRNYSKDLMQEYMHELDRRIILNKVLLQRFRNKNLEEQIMADSSHVLEITLELCHK